MDDSIKKDIMVVVDYLWADEERSFNECDGDENHIFSYLVRIREYLNTEQ
jgi:hypothetical protein